MSGCLPLWACLFLSPLPLPYGHYSRLLDIPKHTDFFPSFQPGLLGPPPHPQDRCLPHQHLIPTPWVLSLIDVSTMPPSPSLGLGQSQPAFNRIYASLSPDKNRRRNPEDLFPSYSRLKNWNSTVCVCTTGLSLDKLTDLGDLFSLKELYSGLKSV